jgi:hypothetical protein
MEHNAEQNTERRKEGRYESMVHIRIQGFDGYALIRNINSSGFCMASKTYVALNRGEIHQMQIMPEEATGISTIELEVEVRWTRTTEKTFAAGFQILQSNSALRAYISYLEAKVRARKN